MSATTKQAIDPLLRVRYGGGVREQANRRATMAAKGKGSKYCPNCNYRGDDNYCPTCKTKMQVGGAGMKPPAALPKPIGAPKFPPSGGTKPPATGT